MTFCLDLDTLLRSLIEKSKEDIAFKTLLFFIHLSFDPL